MFCNNCVMPCSVHKAEHACTHTHTDTHTHTLAITLQKLAVLLCDIRSVFLKGEFAIIYNAA